mgnify:FL=1
MLLTKKHFHKLLNNNNQSRRKFKKKDENKRSSSAATKRRYPKYLEKHNFSVKRRNIPIAHKKKYVGGLDLNFG